MLTSVSIICENCLTINELKEWVHIDSIVSDDQEIEVEIDHIYENSKECISCDTLLVIIGTGSEYPEGSQIKWDFEYKYCRPE